LKKQAVFALTPEDGGGSDFAETIEVLKARLTSAGITQGYKFEVVDGVIELQFDNVSHEIGEDLDYLDALIEKITQVGELTFRDTNNGDTIILRGEHMRGAAATLDSPPNHYRWAISLMFTERGAELFREATTRLAEETGIISIYIDEEFITSAYVHEPITGDSVLITRPEGFDFAEARDLAEMIDSGALPHRLGTRKRRD